MFWGAHSFCRSFGRRPVKVYQSKFQASTVYFVVLTTPFSSSSHFKCCLWPCTAGIPGGVPSEISLWGGGGFRTWISGISIYMCCLYNWKCRLARMFPNLFPTFEHWIILHWEWPQLKAEPPTWPFYVQKGWTRTRVVSGLPKYGSWNCPSSAFE